MIDPLYIMKLVDAITPGFQRAVVSLKISFKCMLPRVLLLDAQNILPALAVVRRPPAFGDTAMTILVYLCCLNTQVTVAHDCLAQVVKAVIHVVLNRVRTGEPL